MNGVICERSRKCDVEDEPAAGSGAFLCNDTLVDCLDAEMYCDGNSDCGPNDDSDEKGCED